MRYSLAFHFPGVPFAIGTNNRDASNREGHHDKYSKVKPPALRFFSLQIVGFAPTRLLEMKQRQPSSRRVSSCTRCLPILFPSRAPEYRVQSIMIQSSSCSIHLPMISLEEEDPVGRRSLSHSKHHAAVHHDAPHHTRVRSYNVMIESFY